MSYLKAWLLYKLIKFGVFVVLPILFTALVGLLNGTIFGKSNDSVNIIMKSQKEKI